MKAVYYRSAQTSVLIVIALMLAACQAGNPFQKPDAELLTPTPVIAGVNSRPAAIGENELDLHPTPETYKNEPPLELTFPAPGSPPEFIWRPPLQEAPLALNPYDHFYFVRPIAADQVNWPLGNYRYGYYFPGLEIIHYGIDIDATQGSPVFAAGSGKVTFTGFGLQNGNNDPEDPYGIAVMIKHDFGFNGQPIYTVYGHMDRVDVINGQRVEAGTQVGIIGNTGATTGPHLHFETRIGGLYSTFQNPELWVVPPQGMGVIAGRITDSLGNPLTSLDISIKSQDTGKVYPARTYAGRAIPEPNLRETMARGDLPAGNYTIEFQIDSENYTGEIVIAPGTINYFTFQTGKGFRVGLPPVTMPAAWLDSLMP